MKIYVGSSGSAQEKGPAIESLIIIIIIMFVRLLFVLSKLRAVHRLGADGREQAKPDSSGTCRGWTRRKEKQRSERT